MVRPKLHKDAKNEATQGTLQITGDKCHCPTGCFIGKAVPLSFNEDEVMHIECLNTKCAWPKVVHNKCFEEWENAMKRSIQGIRATKNWGTEWLHNHLWAETWGWKLIQGKCSCPCGSLMRKDIQYYVMLKTKEGPKPVAVKKKVNCSLPQNPSIKGDTSMKTMKVRQMLALEIGPSFANKIKSKNTLVRSVSDAAKTTQSQQPENAGLPVGMPTLAQIKNQKRKKKRVRNGDSVSETNSQTQKTETTTASVSQETSFDDGEFVDARSNFDADDIDLERHNVLIRDLWSQKPIKYEDDPWLMSPPGFSTVPEPYLPINTTPYRTLNMGGDGFMGEGPLCMHFGYDANVQQYINAEMNFTKFIQAIYH